MRYTLLELGPDERSTYPECWGAGATSDGREIAAADRLVELIPAVSAMPHDNWWLRGPKGRRVAGSRKEFRALPTVARELAWVTREERGV